MNNLIKILLLLLLFKINTFAQINDAALNTIDNTIENIASNINADIDYTTLYEQLIYFYNNPINLNTCSFDDLRKLYFINNFQITSLLNYRKKYGLIYSIYELQLIDGFTNDIITKLTPFVTVKTLNKKQNFSFKNMIKYGNNQLFIRTQKTIEKQAGYNVADSLKTKSNYYLGSQYKVYAKYRFKFSDKIDFGMIVEKDAGEYMLNTKSFLFDFNSAYLQIKKIGIIKKIIIGNYLAQFGQGLTLYRGMCFGKSTDVTNILKSAQGIQKYSSSNELEYFKGIAISIGKNKLKTSLFYSNHNIDGNINTIDKEHYKYTNSLYSTYNHSTIIGLEKKHTINEQAFGGNISYYISNIKIGITGVYSKFNTNVINNNKKDKLFAFSGNSNYNLGANYQLNLNRFYFFGEYAVDKKLHSAFLTGVNTKITEQIYLSMLYRNYSIKYIGLYSNGFSEGSSTNNEIGIYSGIILYPYKSVKISGYWDNFKFNWLKYRIATPSNGFDCFAQAEYTPLKNFMFQMYVRQKIKKQNKNLQIHGVQKITTIKKIKYRFQLAYKLYNSLTFKNRFEQIVYNNNNSINKGYLIYQDINYKFTRIPAKFYIRLAFFDTHNYNSRIYAYENDVLYSFSVPAYYGKGLRYYVMIKYTLFKKIDIWLRFAQTIYKDRNIIGSGLTEIIGNKKSEIKIQLRFKN